MALTRTPALTAALAQSRLAPLPAPVLESLLADAVLLEVPAGGVSQRQGTGPTTTLVVSGLIRVFQTTADGRQVTVRYGRCGDLMGIPSIYLPPRGAPLNQAAMVASVLLVMRPTVLKQVATGNAQVANLFAEESAYRLLNFVEELAGNTFGTMRQRVVRHLLDLAGSASTPGGPLIARVSQQALADSIGSVREVVVRLLRELREDGMVRTGRDEIELLQPDRLMAETFPRDDG